MRRYDTLDFVAAEVTKPLRQSLVVKEEALEVSAAAEPPTRRCESAAASEKTCDERRDRRQLRDFDGRRPSGEGLS